MVQERAVNPVALVAAVSCHYPYVGLQCEEKYAEVLGWKYMVQRVFLMTVGIGGALLSLIVLCRVARRGGSLTQRVIFPFVFMGFLTFIVRGVDPRGYDAVLPPKVFGYMESACNALCYTMCFLLVGVWATLLNVSADAVIKVPPGVALSCATLIFLTWAVFLISDTIYMEDLVANHYLSSGIKLTVMGSILMVSLGYFIYAGVQLNRRIITALRETNNLSFVSTEGSDEASIYSPSARGSMTTSRAPALAVGRKINSVVGAQMGHIIGRDTEDSIELYKDMEAEQRPRRGCVQRLVRAWKKTTKISRVIYIMSTVFFITGVFQLYTSITMLVSKEHYTQLALYQQCRVMNPLNYSAACQEHVKIENIAFTIFAALVCLCFVVLFWDVQYNTMSGRASQQSPVGGYTDMMREETQRSIISANFIISSSDDSSIHSSPITRTRPVTLGGTCGPWEEYLPVTVSHQQQCLSSLQESGKIPMAHHKVFIQSDRRCSAPPQFS